MLELGFQDIRSTVHPGRLRKSRQLTGSNALRNRVLWFGACLKVLPRKMREENMGTEFEGIFYHQILDMPKNLDLGWYLNISCIYIYGFRQSFGHDEKCREVNCLQN